MKNEYQLKSKISRVSDCRVIELKKYSRADGALTVVESNRDVPFDCKRIFYVTTVPQNSMRGEHGHKEVAQFLIAVNGQIEVEVEDGIEKKQFILSHPSQGLFIPPGIWGREKYMSENTILLVLCDDYYSESDYIRDYQQFLNWKEFK